MIAYWQRWGLTALICQSVLSHHVTRCRLLWCCSVLYYTMSVYCLTHCCLYPFVNIFQRKKEICPWEYIERMVLSIIVASMKNEDYLHLKGRNKVDLSLPKRRWSDTRYDSINFLYLLIYLLKFSAGKRGKKTRTNSNWYLTIKQHITVSAEDNNVN